MTDAADEALGSSTRGSRPYLVLLALIVGLLTGVFARGLGDGVREPVLGRAFEYWKSIDPDVGARIEQKVRQGSGDKPAEGMGEG